MPDIFTHVANGKESIKRLNIMEDGYCIQPQNIFFLGCMGPDIFLYHNFYPWKANRTVNELGDEMHTKNCGDFIVSAFEYIKNEDLDEKEILDDMRVLYFLGYICHYAADRIAHPFVFSRSGVYDENNPDTYKLKHAHKIMELSIDYHLARRLYGLDVNKVKMHELLDVGETMPKGIVYIYRKILNGYFGNIVSKLSGDYINESYRAIKSAWKIFYDPIFIKRYTMKVLGYGDYFYPTNPNLRDYMNEKGRDWPHPCDFRNTSREDFYTIFERTVELAADMLKSAIDYLYKKRDINKFKESIGNFSFLTNTDISQNEQRMICFNNIFD
ncbi:hypothetical protein OXPF_22280 [Oxobacter pfennigii]|uniref:Phospholipase C/D domain-containing protein n=1 Tax=Oxobacter pfennigii TaxID=36849 RepID=A0A0P8W7N9_9CLOT|nr:zinc dependent phospholipase C family protein [Oxobacter pfennigii]KPU44062.1 hypothetical protein OXPF_22280 [Oxobacter pfennigii]